MKMVGMRGSRLKIGRDEKVNFRVVALIVASALILANTSGSNPGGELTIVPLEPIDTNPSIEEGKSLRFSVNVSAPEGTIPTYKWTLDGRIVSTSNFWVYSPRFTESGVKIVKLIVNAGNLTASQEWFVTVIDVNRPPKIDSLIPESPTPSVKEGDPLPFLASASDPDGDAVTYLWTLNETEVSRSNSWIYSPGYTEEGTKIVKLTVSDGKGSASHEWIVTVICVNQPPEIDQDYSEPGDRTPTVKEGESLTFFVQASDPDEEDILTYWWTLNAIPVSTSDNWTYTPDYTESGMKNVEVTVSDGDKTKSLKWIVTVN